jgi:hypothetical protein
MRSAGQIMRFMADDANRNLYQRVDTFVGTMASVNRYNGDLLEYGTLDLTDAASRDRFFTSVLGSHGGEIFSFGFCTVDGAFYGAKKALGGSMEILRKDDTTGGIVRHFAVREDLTTGEPLKQGESYDPRTRAWYKAAVETGAPAFSPVYLDYPTNELMVSAGRPIYDKTGGLRGVLVADILLSDLGARLREAVGSDKGYAFIVEKNAGTLVANSLGFDNFSVSPSGALKRYRLDELEIPVIRQVFKRYEANPSPQMFVRSSDLNLHVNAREYHREGLDWIILTVIPETFLMADVLRNIQMTALLVVVAIALSLAIYYAITIKLYKPMDNLLAVAERIASGNLSERALEPAIEPVRLR